MYVRAALYYLVCNKNDNNNICQKIKHFHFKLRARFSVRWPEQQIKMENETESEKKVNKNQNASTKLMGAVNRM